MGRTHSRRALGTTAWWLSALLLATVLGACRSGDAPSAEDTGIADEGGGGEPVELSMALFGDFGYDPLIEEYQEANPHVTVETQIADFEEHHDALVTAIAGGSTPDIVAIEVSYMAAHKAQPQNFHNLLDMGAGEFESNYLDWKWAQALTTDGSALIGLGTDVGPMTMCYRHDLFAEAGLESDRDALAEAWDTWDNFIAFGQQYTEATGKAFLNHGDVIFSSAVNQDPIKYYDEDGSLIYGESPQVRRAWDVATQAITSGITANIEAWSAEWNAGMNNGDYAVLPCPAWMRPYIQDQAPDTAGNWDMTSMPEGGGNWGGSFLALPAAADNAEEAYKFISWLLAPEQQFKVFEDTGNFPSTPELYDTPEIQEFTSEFFNNAPVGQFYAESALANIQPIEGPQDGVIAIEFGNGIIRVESGEETPDEAWESTMEAIKLEVGE